MNRKHYASLLVAAQRIELKKEGKRLTSRIPMGQNPRNQRLVPMTKSGQHSRGMPHQMSIGRILYLRSLQSLIHAYTQQARTPPACSVPRQSTLAQPTLSSPLALPFLFPFFRSVEKHPVSTQMLPLRLSLWSQRGRLTDTLCGGIREETGKTGRISSAEKGEKRGKIHSLLPDCLPCESIEKE